MNSGNTYSPDFSQPSDEYSSQEFAHRGKGFNWKPRCLTEAELARAQREKQQKELQKTLSS